MELYRTCLRINRFVTFCTDASDASLYGIKALTLHPASERRILRLNVSPEAALKQVLIIGGQSPEEADFTLASRTTLTSCRELSACAPGILALLRVSERWDWLVFQEPEKQGEMWMWLASDTPYFTDPIESEAAPH